MEPLLTPTPAAQASPTAQAFACPKPEELARYWPPQGVVGFRYQDRQIGVDAWDTPFGQVRVRGIACGNLRGRGQDAYVAYQLPERQYLVPPAGLTLLAALHSAEGSFTNLGILPFWDRFDSLKFQDITADGKAEVIVMGNVGASGVPAFSIWHWQEGSYREVLQGGSEHGGPQFRDVDGDGKPEIIVYATAVYPRVLGIIWPVVYRWGGQSFRPALVPQVYGDFIAQALLALREGRLKDLPYSESVLHTHVGHAYQLQGRTAEAQAEYERAWDIYANGALRPQPPCTSAAQGVELFYGSIAMGELPLAYATLGEAYRRAQPFPDFAAGFARTRKVQLLEPAKVVGQEGDITLVAVRLRAKDLAPQGEVEQRLAGTWRVRQQGQVCTLERGDIRQE